MLQKHDVTVKVLYVDIYWVEFHGENVIKAYNT